MADAGYRHSTIPGSRINKGTISVAPLLEDEDQEDFVAILSVRNVVQWGESLGADENIRDCII
jgi:hypothetical protein